MRNKHIYLLVVFILLFVTVGFAQKPNYTIRNYIGIQAGISQFDIITDNFETEQSTGWSGGLMSMVHVPHKWYDFSYGIYFSDNKVDVFGRRNALSTDSQQLEYKLSAVQLMLLMHAKIFRENLMIDFGPSIQANGKLELQDMDQESYFINGFDTLQAKDIEEISKFNVNGVIGGSAGFRNFRFRVQYQYGFTNMLNKLNDDLDLDTKLKGNHSQLTFAVMVLF